MNRYEDVPGDLEVVFKKVVKERFPGLINTNFKLLFDNKKRVQKGKITLASIELANEKIKYFSAGNDIPEGYDYIIVIDKVAWEYAHEDDRERVLSHELCHVFIDEKGKYKIVNHDIEDFLAEIKRNADKPNWGVELATLISSIYEQSEEEKN